MVVEKHFIMGCSVSSTAYFVAGFRVGMKKLPGQDWGRGQ